MHHSIAAAPARLMMRGPRGPRETARPAHRQRHPSQLWKRLRPVKVRRARPKIRRAEEPLIRRAQDERDIHAACIAKVDPRAQQVERHGHRRQPRAVRREFGERRHLGHRNIHVFRAHPRRGEFTSPPGPVRCQIELEITSAIRRGHEPLRHIMTPQLLLKPPRPRLRVQHRGPTVPRHKPQPLRIHRQAERRRRLHAFAVPILHQPEHRQIQLTPGQGLPAFENRHASNLPPAAPRCPVETPANPHPACHGPRSVARSASSHCFNSGAKR